MPDFGEAGCVFSSGSGHLRVSQNDCSPKGGNIDWTRDKIGAAEQRGQSGMMPRVLEYGQ